MEQRSQCKNAKDKKRGHAPVHTITILVTFHIHHKSAIVVVWDPVSHQCSHTWWAEGAWLDINQG
jgi:hypothetical protein